MKQVKDVRGDVSSFWRKYINRTETFYNPLVNAGKINFAQNGVRRVYTLYRKLRVSHLHLHYSDHEHSFSLVYLLVLIWKYHHSLKTLHFLSNNKTVNVGGIEEVANNGKG